MHRLLLLSICGLAFASASADQELLNLHCAECHNDEKAKGKFNLRYLGDRPDPNSLNYWLDAWDLVAAEEMPPDDESQLTLKDRAKLLAFLESKVRGYESTEPEAVHTTPRRLNNREFANSIADVLLIEDVGTHHPTDSLVGDSLYHGFDTHGETLGFSRFHLEQYVESLRRIVDATILPSHQPESQIREFSSQDILSAHTNQNTTRPERRGTLEGFDFLDPKQNAYFEGFKSVPNTGFYRIKIRATGIDRLVYPSEQTGFYHGDPLQLNVALGDRVKSFDLPDEKVVEIHLKEWLAAGTHLLLQHPTDAFAQFGNGNFKFQYRIVPMHLQEHHPERYAEYVRIIQARLKNSRKDVSHWSNWTEWWQGGRPRILSATIEGPIFETWPPKRQVALLGKDPQLEDALQILQPIAERAWRRPIREGELDSIVELVTTKAQSMPEVDAFKEGIIAILVSPSFLLLHTKDVPAADRFAAKLSFFLKSTIPSAELLQASRSGQLNSQETVRELLVNEIAKGGAAEFLREFPYAWLELNDINFMAPDPDRYRFYHRKRVSEDMINEVLHFFRHAAENNIPIPELVSADYSFINADLAQLYGVSDVPEDSIFRKYTFEDGRRGGLLGTGAFLTVTADSLATSPIHRAVYVMENFMGIHPTPPPPDVEITEPDIRQAKTVKEILEAHVSDQNCASCHETIDPWGYAFENFDPTGAWRQSYSIPVALTPSQDDPELLAAKLWKNETIPVDSSARFRNGIEYQDIREFRQQLLTEANRDRFVRCFIEKVLIYANGEAPSKTDFVAIDQILTESAKRDYRIVDTLAAIVDSQLFRR